MFNWFTEWTSSFSRCGPSIYSHISSKNHSTCGAVIGSVNANDMVRTRIHSNRKEAYTVNLMTYS